MEPRDKYFDTSSPIYTEINDGLRAAEERSISGENSLSGRKETAFYVHARQVISCPNGVVFVLGENSKEVFCNKCKSQVWTKLRFKSGLLTWLCFGSCFLYGYARMQRILALLQVFIQTVLIEI